MNSKKIPRRTCIACRGVTGKRELIRLVRQPEGRVSVDSSGREANSTSNFASISGDGALVTFQSFATNLVSGDTNGATDIFLRDRIAGITTLLSTDSSGVLGNGESYVPKLATNGDFVAFYSDASNLVPGDTNDNADDFVRRVRGADASWSNYDSGWPGTNGVPSITPSAAPKLGTTISIQVGDSLGAPTTGLFLVGTQRASIPSVWGGDLLVLPTFASVIDVGASGWSITCDVPPDDSLSGLVLCAQALELDPGASRGISFTAGLELVLGD